ncbi:HU family DNA-binding protein [Parabacteroides sp. AM08-6]|uniref:HU family DNA-binding protein n=1 Tax=Parabacteroides sp. AM08-6 TaxID=2292053 RepID=UPI000F005003|nr:HU family DNA-binding protein [Parabacteroides sp. AM08-6]RHJ82996.1 DNA-binding protein [Parabacteroides sp. AM08-6]
MRRVGFSVYDLPGKNQASCARLISNGTKNMQEVCEYINECCSVTSSDIKGVLDALSNYIGHQLSNGYSVELDGFGHFSPALKTQKKEDKENGKTVFTVSVDGVNFRCAPELKEKVKECRPKKVKRENEATSSREERKTQMLEYLQNHHSINISDYAILNQCTYYTAQHDIKKYEEEGYIQQEGYKTHRVYRLTEKGTECKQPD